MRFNNRLTKHQNQILSELEKLTVKSGIRVSASKLSYAGLKLKGGECLLRDIKWLVIDNYQSFEEQLFHFRAALSQVNLPRGALEKLSPQALAALYPPSEGSQAMAALELPKEGLLATAASAPPEDVPLALAASALAGTALRRGGPDILSWAGTGFRDTTRVGASPPLKWVEVAMENSANLTDCLDALIEVLTGLKEAIAQKNEPELTKLLEEFSAFRRALPQK